jgi:hypothetical protein
LASTIEVVEQINTFVLSLIPGKVLLPHWNFIVHHYVNQFM